MKNFDIGITITGSGSATPKTLFDNQDMSQIVATSNKWIETRTGIKTRHLASEYESLSECATQAAEKALEMARITAKELDLIILATQPEDIVAISGFGAGLSWGAVIFQWGR